nr:unnamed protein product [Digitaria exilis]
MSGLSFHLLSLPLLGQLRNGCELTATDAIQRREIELQWLRLVSRRELDRVRGAGIAVAIVYGEGAGVAFVEKGAEHDIDVLHQLVLEIRVPPCGNKHYTSTTSPYASLRCQTKSLMPQACGLESLLQQAAPSSAVPLALHALDAAWPCGLAMPLDPTAEPAQRRARGASASPLVALAPPDLHPDSCSEGGSGDELDGRITLPSFLSLSQPPPPLTITLSTDLLLCRWSSASAPLPRPAQRSLCRVGRPSLHRTRADAGPPIRIVSKSTVRRSALSVSLSIGGGGSQTSMHAAHIEKITDVVYNPEDPPSAYTNPSIHSRLSAYTEVGRGIQGPWWDPADLAEERRQREEMDQRMAEQVVQQVAAQLAAAWEAERQRMQQLQLWMESVVALLGNADQARSVAGKRLIEVARATGYTARCRWYARFRVSNINVLCHDEAIAASNASKATFISSSYDVRRGLHIVVQYLLVAAKLLEGTPQHTPRHDRERDFIFPRLYTQLTSSSLILACFPCQPARSTAACQPSVHTQQSFTGKLTSRRPCSLKVKTAGLPDLSVSGDNFDLVEGDPHDPTTTSETEAPMQSLNQLPVPHHEDQFLYAIEERTRTRDEQSIYHSKVKRLGGGACPWAPRGGRMPLQEWSRTRDQRKPKSCDRALPTVTALSRQVMGTVCGVSVPIKPTSGHTREITESSPEVEIAPRPRNIPSGHARASSCQRGHANGAWAMSCPTRTCAPCPRKVGSDTNCNIPPLRTRPERPLRPRLCVQLPTWPRQRRMGHVVSHTHMRTMPAQLTVHAREIARVGSDTNCNVPPLWAGPDLKNAPQTNTCLFCALFPNNFL